MTPVVVSAVLTVSLFLYNYFRLGIELMESLRNAIIMLALCVVFSLPVGRWETRLVENTEPITAELIYVTPCDHHIEAGGHATYITPPIQVYLHCVLTKTSMLCSFARFVIHARKRSRLI